MAQVEDMPTRPSGLDDPMDSASNLCRRGIEENGIKVPHYRDVPEHRPSGPNVRAPIERQRVCPRLPKPGKKRRGVFGELEPGNS